MNCQWDMLMDYLEQPTQPTCASHAEFAVEVDKRTYKVCGYHHTEWIERQEELAA